MHDWWSLFTFLLLIIFKQVSNNKKRDRYFIPMKESRLYTTGPAGINLPLPILPPHHQSSASLAPPVRWMVILHNLPGGLIEMHFKNGSLGFISCLHEAWSVPESSTWHRWWQRCERKWALALWGWSDPAPKLMAHNLSDEEKKKIKRLS